MSNKEKNFSWMNISNGIINITPYKTIREDVIDMIKDVYDLDEVIENSADYIFASNISLAIWNLMNLIEKSYEQHNIEFAEGVMLDKIMSYYGKYRNRRKSYVLDVELEGSDHDKFNADNLLFNFNKPSQEFKYIRKISSSKDKSIYRVIAKDFYRGLNYDDVKKLDLRSRDGNIYTSNEPNIKIINFQSEEESDGEFKGRFSYSSSNELYSILRKNEFIKKINILNPSNEVKNIFSNAVNSNKIINGQTCIILEMTDEYYKLSDEEKKPINIDIDIVISEYLNLGTQTIKVPQYKLNEDQNSVDSSTELNNYFEVITQRSPKNDFIDQSITFNILKNVFGYIEFETFTNDDIKNRIEDVINLLNKKSIFYQYDKIDVLNTIEEVLNINKNKSIKWGYSTSDKYNPLELKESNWINNSELDNNTFTKDDVLMNKWSIYNNENNNLYNLPVKMKFSNYIYKEQEDGTIRVLIY